MHPFQTITFAHDHVAELQSTAKLHRLARRARRGGGGPRSPAPPAGTESVTRRFLTAADERRRAA